MYAVIRDGGRQFTVREGDRILVDLKNLQADAEVRFDQVLLVGDEKGAKIGKPTVEGASVLGKVLGEKKGEKLIAFKFRRRKDSKSKKGHRQKYTAVKVEKITG
ncbi:MAG TPA: 50S ribosomal protein L21 [Planctomycetota bacterium]|nr:50S ribosomal protein L21 [Planctomycetota bacterium]